MKDNRRKDEYESQFNKYHCATILAAMAAIC